MDGDERIALRRRIAEVGPRGTAHEGLQGAEMQAIAGPNAVAPRCNYAPAKFYVFP